ncbi:hypothetical protein B484DRAFT_411393, partial [Ochromonadaceae sp. CCMP2298]
MSDEGSCYTSGNAKGRKKDTYTSEARKKQCYSSLEMARAARHTKTSTGSVAASTMTSSSTSSVTPTDITADLGSVKRTRETAGVSGEEFITGMHDFRAFGRRTWADLVDMGVVDVLLNKLAAYWNCRTLPGKAKLLVSAEELPLSSAAQMNLHERVLAMQAVLKDLHGRFGGSEPMNRITECTEDIASTLGTSGKRVRRWALQFIILEGMFKSVAYKCRASNSIINDEAARAHMIQWMVTASNAKPPAKAADF